jgi:hypothetical protein
MDFQDTKMLSFRCPNRLSDAVQRLADRELISVSDVIRQSVLKELRQRGLMEGGNAA